MIFVLNRHEEVETVLSNDNPDSCPYLEDKLTEDLYTGAASYEFKVPTLHPASDYINVGDFIMRKGLDNDLMLFQVIQTEEVSSFAQEKLVYAETAGLELLNDIIRPVSHMSKSAKQILTICLADTRWQVGTVEYLGVDNFNFENYDNVFSTLQAVSDKMGGELIFRATMKNGKITGRYVDLIKKRGTDTKKRFVYSKDIKSVWRKTDLSQLTTALIGVGKGENDVFTTFKSISRSKSGGDAFSKPLNQDWVGDPGALQQFGVKGKHIFGVYEYDTADPNVLLDKTWAQLQKVKNPSVTYELDVALLERLADIEHESVRIGDTVYIVDEAFSPPLYLEARVINLETSFSDPKKDKCTLGNYKIAKSNITKELRAIQSKLLYKEKTWDSSLFTWVMYADDENGAGMTASPDGKQFIGFAYNKTIETPSNNPADYKFSRMTGEGVPGQPGTTFYTWVKYADNASGGGLSDSPTGKKYMGIAINKTTQTESEIPTDYTWSLIQGPQGAAGKGISSVTEYYLATSASSGVTVNTSGWTTAFQALTATNKYLWNYEQIAYTDGALNDTVPVIIGTYGDTGTAGKGISSIVEKYLATSAATGVTTATTGWTTSVQTVTNTNKYLWNYETITYTDSSQTTTTPVVIGVYGDTGSAGKGVSSIVEEYYLSTSNTAQSGGAWSTTVPTWVDGKYIWTRSVITYTDSTSTTTTPVCVTGGTGSTGNGITSVDVEYYLSTSNTTQTGGSWSTTAPAWADGKYMWSRTKTVYTNGTTVYSNPACITGGKGDTGSTGKGISSVTEYYLASSAATGVTTSTTGWATTMQSMSSTNKYLWNYEKVTYTDSTTTNSTPVVIGVYGDTGGTGSPGKGISSITEYYLATASASGVTTATAGWTTAIQTITSTNKYLWNYEKVTYTDSSTTNTTPVIIGVYGDKGDDGGTGAPGKGISSITEYYLATASSSGVTTGTAGWTTTVQSITTTNKYLWNYEKITYTDSSTTTTTPAIIGVYGDTGGTGSPGKGISSITEYYLASTAASGVTTATAGWTTTVQTITATTKYLWNYEKITYTDSSTTSTTPAIIGVYGDTGGKGDTGDPGDDGQDAIVGYSTNPYFKNWTTATTVPNGYGVWNTVPTRESTITRRGGYGVRFTVAAATDSRGMNFSTTLASAPKRDYYVLEFDVYIVSATSLNGAGFLLDFYPTTGSYTRVRIPLATELPTYETGKWYNIRKVIPIPITTLSTITGFVMGNYNSSELLNGGVKDIIYDYVNLREATSAEIYGYTTGSIVDGWTDDSTGTPLILGTKVKANTIFADKIAVGDFTNYVDDPTFKLGVYSPTTPWSIDSTTVRVTGGRSVKLSATTTDYPNLILNKSTIPVKNGDKFYAEFWAYRDSANQPININIGVQGHDGTWDYDSDGNPTATATATNLTWIKYTSMITVTKDGNATIYFKVPSANDMTGNWYVSEPVVRRAYTGEMIVDGTIKASHIQSLNGLNVGSGNLVIDASGNVTLKGSISSGSTMSLASGKFVVDASGNVKVQGDISGSTGSFSGDLAADTLYVEPALFSANMALKTRKTTAGATQYANIVADYDGTNPDADTDVLRMGKNWDWATATMVDLYKIYLAATTVELSNNLTVTNTLSAADVKIGGASIYNPTFTNVSLNTGVTALSGRTPRYTKMGKLVTVEGEINNVAAGTTIATLPSGYRPPSTRIFKCAMNSSGSNDGANVYVHTDGTVVVQSVANATNSISLCGISFYVN